MLSCRTLPVLLAVTSACATQDALTRSDVTEVDVLSDAYVYEIEATSCVSLKRERLGWGWCRRIADNQQLHVWALSTKAHRPPAGLYLVDPVKRRADIEDWSDWIRDVDEEYDLITSYSFELSLAPDTGEQQAITDALRAIVQQSDVGSIGIWQKTADIYDTPTAALYRSAPGAARALGSLIAALNAARSTTAPPPVRVSTR